MELFISTAIVFMVGIAIYTTFSNGISVWRRANVNRELERDISIAFTKLSRDLKNTFKFSLIPFEGEEGMVSFPALINVAPVTEEPIYEVGRIVYFFDDGKQALCKETKTYPMAYRNSAIENEHVSVSISGVSSLKFTYCYLDGITNRYKWKDSWKKEEQDTIPQAVNLDIVFKKEEDKSFSFTKTIFIPVGTGEQTIELGTSSKATKDEG